MSNKNRTFDLILSGVGGQGVITLARILAQAALSEKNQLRTSELHGLSQRGGSVQVHLRFGAEVFSPLVRKGQADLIISLETQEALVAAPLGSKTKGTVFLVNEHRTATLSETCSDQEIEKHLKQVSSKTILIPATKKVKKELGREVTAGVFMLGVAVAKGFLPLKFESLKKGLKQVLPEKYWSLNLKTLELARNN